MQTMAKWQEFLEKRDASIREEIILHYVPLVKYFVYRLHLKIPSHLSHEDLEGFGLLGLIDAVDRYDPSFGVKFETYASYRIRGSIIDEVRKANWLPRSLFQKMQEISKMYREAEQAGVLLTDQQAADKVGLSLEDFLGVMAGVSNLSVMSLEEIFNGSAGEGVRAIDLVSAENSPNPEEIVETRELRIRLANALEKLNEKDRLVLSLYYNEGLTMKEIGAVIHVSESRVCQLHGRAILRLKGLMGE